MTIIASCPECGRSLMVPGAMAGKKTNCPSCDAAVPVPTLDEERAALGSAYRLQAVEHQQQRKQRERDFYSSPLHKPVPPTKRVEGHDDSEESLSWRDWLSLLFRGRRGDE